MEEQEHNLNNGRCSAAEESITKLQRRFDSGFPIRAIDQPPSIQLLLWTLIQPLLNREYAA